MDAETNKCLAALANPTPPEPKSLRSEILTPGSAARNKFCWSVVNEYNERGTRYGNIRRLTCESTLSEVLRAVADQHGGLEDAELQELEPVIQRHLDKENAEKRAKAESQRIERAAQSIERLHQVAGKRLASATLENYRATTPEQAAILATIKEYAGNIKERIAEGVGLVLNGPSGNGKDHLLISAARSAIQVGAVVCWKNGQDLLREFRDRIGTDESEESLLAPLVSADVLVISDPLPPSGSLTDYQASMIYCVLDARYRDCKATWASMNVTSRKEADNRIGVAIVDRLRHGALCLACNWPSYRKPFEAVK